MATAAPLSCAEFWGLLLQAGRGCCWYLFELAQKDPLKAAPFTWLLLVKRVMLFAGWYSVCGMWVWLWLWGVVEVAFTLDKPACRGGKPYPPVLGAAPLVFRVQRLSMEPGQEVALA